MPNPLENKLLLYYMSGLGGALGGEGSAAQAVGGITQQQIQTENFQKLLKTLLAGGGKFGMDKEGMSLKAPVGAFRDTDLSIPGFEESYSAIGGELPRRDTFNPSASPLDVGGADLAGLTPEMISQALQLKFGMEELERKKLADITEAGYYGAATRKMEAETKAITPSIDVGGGIVLTNAQFINWWKAANKDDRTAAVKNFEYAREGGYKGSFETWMADLAKASGMPLAEFMARRWAVEEIGQESELTGPDFAQDVRTDLMKDKSTWGYPPTYEGLVEKGFDETKALDMSQKIATVEEMDRRIRSFYKGKEVERRKKGWYVDGKLKVRNPYYGRD